MTWKTNEIKSKERSLNFIAHASIGLYLAHHIEEHKKVHLVSWDMNFPLETESCYRLRQMKDPQATQTRKVKSRKQGSKLRNCTY